MFRLSCPFLVFSMIELSETGSSDFLKMPRRTLKGEEKWADIEDLINRWAKRNPTGAVDNERWVKEAQSDLKDKKHGRSGAESMGRIGISIHPELMQYIQAFYPDFMESKDDLHEFMKRFKKFRVPELT